MGSLVTRTLALVCTLALLPGCSLLFAHGPPADHARASDFTCSRRYTGPIVDTSFAAGGLAVLTLPTDGGGGLVGGSRALEFTTLAIAWAVLFGGSAVYGYGSVADCREALEAMNARQARIAPAAPPSMQGAPGSIIACVTNAHCRAGGVCIRGGCYDAVPLPAPVPSAPAPSHEAPVLLFADPPPPALPQPQPAP